MQRYGKTKRKGNAHSHGHECPICSEQDLSKSAKHRARQAGKKEIENEINGCDGPVAD